MIKKKITIKLPMQLPFVKTHSNLMQLITYTTLKAIELMKTHSKNFCDYYVYTLLKLKQEPYLNIYMENYYLVKSI